MVVLVVLVCRLYVIDPNFLWNHSMRRESSHVDTYLKQVTNNHMLSRNAVDKKIIRVCLVCRLRLTDLSDHIVESNATHFSYANLIPLSFSIQKPIQVASVKSLEHGYTRP